MPNDECFRLDDVDEAYVAFNVIQNGPVEQLASQRVLLARLDTGDLVVHQSVAEHLEKAGFDKLEFEPV